RQPWPGMLMTIHGDDERYKEEYWTRFPGLYYAGDYAVKDAEGYFRILGRADEVLKVAGHRLGSLEIENAAVAHPSIAEAAAVGVPDPVKGDEIVIFAVLMDGYEPSSTLEDELREHIRRAIGPIATPKSIYLVRVLPKTRSGKIMRRVLRSVASNEPVGDISTLEDEASVDEVKRAYEALKREV
ncbi:MAG: acetyl-CoA synthetase, partial [Dehalococcoidia bacterium]